MDSLTIPEAAQALGVSPTTLRIQVKLGKLAATKRGRDYFVDRKEVERYRAVSLRTKVPA